MQHWPIFEVAPYVFNEFVFVFVFVLLFLFVFVFWGLNVQHWPRFEVADVFNECKSSLDSSTD